MVWVDPERIPLLVSAGATVLLAAVLLAIDFHKRVNRAFAAVLALRGLIVPLFILQGGPRADLAMAQAIPYLMLPLVPLTLYFASIYPRRRGPLGRPGGGWVTLGLVLALDGLYLFWHGGYAGLAHGTAELPIMQARSGVVYTDFGPLTLLGMAAFPLLSGLSLLFAHDYTRSEPGRQRTSYFLVAAGFMLNGIFDGTRQAAGMVQFIVDADQYPWTPWGWTIAVLPSLSLVPAGLALAVIARHHFATRKGDERRMETRLYVMAGLAAATGLAPAVIPGWGAYFSSSPIVVVLLGFWRLTLPLLVTYALLRYALFDIDLKVRAAVAWGVVAGLFAFAWFVGSNLLQNLLAEWSGTGDLGGLVAAALLAWATHPMVAFGRWTAAKLMPGVHDFSKRTRDAAAVYKEQFLMLQEDGMLTPKERACLERLRTKLELPKAMVRTLEAEVRAKSGAARGPAGAAA